MTELGAGKAGEHLVCFDLLTQGVEAFLSAQGLAFDVVALHDGKTYKVQVKTCFSTRNDKYTFNIRAGKGAKRANYSNKDVDIIAFVALQTKEIAYLPLSDCKSIVEFMVSANRGNYKSEIVTEKVRNALACRQQNPTMPLKAICQHFGLSFNTFSKVYQKCEYDSRFSLRYFSDYPFFKAIGVL